MPVAQTNWLFWSAGAPNTYWIQNVLKANDCNNHSFLNYDENAANCLAPCNPTAAGSACANWTNDYSRVSITSTNAFNKKKFRLERIEVTDLLGKCFYYRVYAAAASGCLSTKPYWMTFVDSTTSVVAGNPNVPYLKWYLNLVNTFSISAKRAAAFDFPGLETGSVCTLNRIL